MASGRHLGFVAVALAVACSDPESAEQRYEELVAKNQIECGHDEYTCRTPTVVDCLNDALASGARASYVISTYEDIGTTIGAFFTVDHHVEIFIKATDGQAQLDMPSALATGVCSGPFDADACDGTQSSNLVDGCAN
jgi:hypothetical protein